MTHVDLFSGIGGFALAAQANGLKTVCFCEVDKRCQEFLGRAWPGVKIYDDIRTFNGAEYRGAYLLTAGVPCQPASRAGQQRGAEDDRWLWPDAIRVLGLVKPTWALLENPPGIGDVGLARIIADVEAEGYEVRVFSIPACAVGAPHGRERYWIVADSAGERYKRGDAKPEAHGQHSEHHQGVWGSFVWLPCADGKLRRAPDDSFGLVDGLHRSVLAALGNSIVPQVAAEIIRAMMTARWDCFNTEG